MVHVPVMVREVVEWMNLRRGGVYVDGTCGGGGHSAAMLDACPGIRIIGLDKDADAAAAARGRLGGRPAFEAVHAGYETLDAVLEARGVPAVDGVLLDLGFSTDQVGDPERGFSFQREGPLDMRFDRGSGLTAADIVNGADRRELARIFGEYGEIPRPERLADRIVERRKRRPFETTTDLAGFAAGALRRRPGLHPATLVFQALRIEVNRELEAVAAGLAAAERVLRQGGRVAVISFHSLEDRIVKRRFRESPGLAVLTRKPVRPGADETNANRESRSAKLRVAEKR